MPLSPSELARVTLAPALLALVVLAVGWRAWHRDAVDRGTWAGPVALALAVLVAYPAATIASRLPSFPPAETLGWLFYITLAAMFVGLFDALVSLPWGWRIAMVFTLAAAACAAMLKFKVPDAWMTSRFIVVVLIFAIVTTLWWLSLEPSLVRPGVEGPLTLLAIGAALALVFAMNESLKAAQLAGALAGGAGAAVVLAPWCGGARLVRGSAVVFSVVSICLLLNWYFLRVDYESVHYVLLAGLVATPMFAGAVGAIVARTNLFPNTQSLIRLSAIMLPLSVLLAISAARFAKSMPDDQGYELSRAGEVSPRHARAAGLYDAF